MKHEAIVLCGGEGWRLKPGEWTPKPLLKITATETLLDKQLRWLLENGFDRIILASNRSYNESALFSNSKVELCIEKKKLGTGGAVKRAFKLVGEEKAYVMNVDDIVFYEPKKLYAKATRGAAVLLAKPQLPFGKVTVEEGEDAVTSFEQRPVLGIWVNAGHYVFSKELVIKYFPAEGDFEWTAMQEMAKDKLLQAMRYSGDWLTLNTVKDLIGIQEYFKKSRMKKSLAKRIKKTTGD